MVSSFSTRLLRKFARTERPMVKNLIRLSNEEEATNKYKKKRKRSIVNAYNDLKEMNTSQRVMRTVKMMKKQMYIKSK